ncbi:MAG: hypothetical protein AB1502_03030 [Thermodesulfobacteriota bacterium]
MFEDYLEDAHYFCLTARALIGEREKKRYYRASVFCGISSMEAFINYIGDTFAEGNVFEPYEIALLNDMKFAHDKGKFKILGQIEYHRLEDKLRFLICKFVPKFDFNEEVAWFRFIEFKKFRDAIMHPRQDEDTIKVAEYERKIKIGLSSTIKIMDYLCKGIFKKPLRKKLIDLTL